MVNEKLEFKNGLIFVRDIQCYLFPFNSILAIFNEIIEHESKDSAISLLTNSSLIDAKILFEEISTIKTTNLVKIKSFLDFLNYLGMGEVKLQNYTPNKISFLISKSIFSIIYKDLFKKEPKLLLEHIHEGYLKNFCSLLFNREVSSSLKKLRNNTILIEIEISSHKLNLDPSIRDYVYEQVVRKHELSNTLKKIIANKHIKVNNGTFNIWNMYCVLTPYFYLIELTKNIKDRYSEFFSYLGKVQGKAATDIQMQLYGLNSEIIFQSVIEQSEISAMGRVQILSKKPFKYTILNNLDSYFKQYYPNNEYICLNNYFRNNFRGVFETCYNVKTDLFELDNICQLTINKNLSSADITDKEKELQKIINMRNLVTKISLH